MLRSLLGLGCAGWMAVPRAAQQREGDEAWNHGRHDEARAAYEPSIRADRLDRFPREPADRGHALVGGEA